MEGTATKVPGATLLAAPPSIAPTPPLAPPPPIATTAKSGSGRARPATAPAAAPATPPKSKFAGLAETVGSDTDTGKGKEKRGMLSELC